MSEATEATETTETTGTTGAAAPDRDAPAAALGPTALVLGLVAATGAWPGLVLATLPWSIIAGGLAVTFGVAGIHYARLGIGRMWTAVAGAALGVTGLVGVATLFALISA
ncbi:hypothetical protein ACFQVC_18630 [Streptomyces monticola]|uniref:Uncharacterized protein n=1 Tax=Streptomyces monticola TaxID=2666263 RepID=A0ABW2JKS1_9ACTN